MAKSSRRNQQIRTSDRDSHRSSSAARSRSGSAMASRWPGSPGQQSEVSSEKRRIQRRYREAVTYGRVPTSKDLFGTWQLPTPQRPQTNRSEAVSTCVARHQRREVLFATRRTGAGSYSRKLTFNNKRCK